MKQKKCYTYMLSDFKRKKTSKGLTSKIFPENWLTKVLQMWLITNLEVRKQNP